MLGQLTAQRSKFRLACETIPLTKTLSISDLLLAELTAKFLGFIFQSSQLSTIDERVKLFPAFDDLR
jgi:hypothetical protein